MLERVAFERCDWSAMDAMSDRVLFQTREWLDFLGRSQRAEPVVAEVLAGGERVGWFTGAVVSSYGVRILGSPFPGWTTPWMGFNLRDGVDRWAAASALAPFAFHELGCLHLELRDRLLDAPSPEPARLAWTDLHTYELDLAPPEDEMLARMSGACRRALRKSEKCGVRIEEASGEGFADEYYAQLEDVFAKQGLEPTYPVQRVRDLIGSLEPSGRLLLLRALSPDGERIATGIFPAMNGTAYFWGGASWRPHQHMRPNEAIFWYAMRRWKAAGYRTLDMGGGGAYKLKYGPRLVTVPFFRRSRVPLLGRLRDVAARIKTRGY